MNKPHKFLLMVATIGLMQLSAMAQAQDIQSNNQTTPNATMEKAKDFFSNSFTIGKAAINSALSQPTQDSKNIVEQVGNSEAAQKTKGFVSDIFTIGKATAQNAVKGATAYANETGKSQTVTESQEEAQKTAIANANAERAKSFFTNLLNKSKEATNSVVSTLQDSSQPDPIAEIALSEKVTSTVVTPNAVSENINKMRDNSTKKKTKLTN